MQLNFSSLITNLVESGILPVNFQSPRHTHAPKFRKISPSTSDFPHVSPSPDIRFWARRSDILTIVLYQYLFLHFCYWESPSPTPTSQQKKKEATPRTCRSYPPRRPIHSKNPALSFLVRLPPPYLKTPRV